MRGCCVEYFLRDKEGELEKLFRWKAIATEAGKRVAGLGDDPFFHWLLTLWNHESDSGTCVDEAAMARRFEHHYKTLTTGKEQDHDTDVPKLEYIYSSDTPGTSATIFEGLMERRTIDLATSSIDTNEEILGSSLHEEEIRTTESGPHDEYKGVTLRDLIRELFPKAPPEKITTIANGVRNSGAWRTYREDKMTKLGPEPLKVGQRKSGELHPVLELLELSKNSPTLRGGNTHGLSRRLHKLKRASNDPPKDLELEFLSRTGIR